MKNFEERPEEWDVEQLRLEADIRRALLEDVAAGDVHRHFLQFKNACTPAVQRWRFAASAVAMAAACLLALVLLSRQR